MEQQEFSELITECIEIIMVRKYHNYDSTRTGILMVP